MKLTREQICTNNIMAFFSKVSGEDESNLTTNLLTCPLCEDEYDDPKRLPCMHTICLRCLESVVPQNSLILTCPIDNQELPMPKGGVNALPSDMKIVRLLELSSGNQTAKKKPRTAKKSPKISDENNKNKSVQGPVAASLEEEAELVKNMISEAAEKIRQAITTKENEIRAEVDDVVKKEMRKRASTASYSSPDNADMPDSPTLNGDDSVFEEAVDSKGKSKDDSKGKAKPPVPPKRPPSFLVDLTPSRKLLQLAKEEGLGKCQYGRKMTVASSDQSTPSPIASSTPTYGGAAEVIGCINLPNRYKRTFAPTAVAVSRDGHVAVSDFGSECVLLFDLEGNFHTRIGEGDCNEGGLEGPDGLAFLSDNSLVVSDGPLDGVQAIKIYQPTGEYLRTIVEVNPDEEEGGDGLFFGRISTDSHGRIILCCSGEEPCVRVFDSQGKTELEFGDGIIHGPQKAVFHNDKFFVSDSNLQKHKCNIKMFDKMGKFLCMFDDNKLNVGEQDSLGLDVTYPIHICADRGTILAYHGLTKSIRLYKTDGTFVIEFRTVTGIRDIEVNEEGNIVASCGEDSMLPRSVQILRY